MSTDYETYAILDVQLHRGAASVRVLKLYSKPAGLDGAGLLLRGDPALTWGPSSDGAEGAGSWVGRGAGIGDRRGLRPMSEPRPSQAGPWSRTRTS